MSILHRLLGAQSATTYIEVKNFDRGTVLRLRREYIYYDSERVTRTLKAVQNEQVLPLISFKFNI